MNKQETKMNIVEKLQNLVLDGKSETQVNTPKSKETIIDNDKALTQILGMCAGYAYRGYGSIKLSLDKAYDLWGVIEKEERAYSAEQLIMLIKECGLSSHISTDDYDFVEINIIWDITLSSFNVGGIFELE